MDRLMKSLLQLQKVPSRASKAVAAMVDEKLDMGFLTSRDPYGNAWRPLKRPGIPRGRLGGPLLRWGDLYSGTRAFPTPGAGVGIVAGADYGKYHLSTRPFLPTSGLPATWIAEIKQIVAGELNATIGGK